MILGSKNEVERIVRYHWEHDKGIDRRYSSPLFNERSLFRPERELTTRGTPTPDDNSTTEQLSCEHAHVHQASRHRRHRFLGRGHQPPS